MRCWDNFTMGNVEIISFVVNFDCLQNGYFMGVCQGMKQITVVKIINFKMLFNYTYIKDMIYKKRDIKQTSWICNIFYFKFKGIYTLNICK